LREGGWGPALLNKDDALTHTILVTGANGQLAGAIIAAYRDRARVRAYSREQLDIADYDAVKTRVDADRPAVIINCAAYNNVDGAEDDAETALRVNAFGVRTLARAAADSGAGLVHYSTDFVFDGLASRPYIEADAPNPQSVYGQSKLLGEWFALEAPRAYVLRVESLFGGRAAKSSIDKIAQALKSRQPARVFVDRVVTPSYVVDVAAATQALVERGTPGLYHCVGTGHATWYEVGEAIADIVNGASRQFLAPVRVADVRLRAPRPQYAALSNAKLSAVVQMPTWQDALRRYLA
jgi:dTDP-4-dehydrorhamnose reductase